MTARDRTSIAGYVHGHQPTVLQSHATRSAVNSCAYLLPHIERGMRILDIGCGPGSITLDLAQLVGSGQVMGVDPSVEAIQVARSAALERGDRTTSFLCADLFDLDFEPGSFDIVHAHQVLQHLTDPVAALKKMSELVAPEGLIAVLDVDYAAMAWFPASEGIARWHQTYCAIARSMGGEPDAGRHLKAWGRAAGLDIKAATSSTWTYASTSETRWWGDTQAERIVASSFTARAAKAGFSEAEIRAMSDGWRAWGADEDAWFLMPHGELLARRPAAAGGVSARPLSAPPTR